MLKRALVILMCTFLLHTLACAEGIEYVDAGGEVALNGDFAARAVIERSSPTKYNAEGGIRIYYSEDMTYYAFFIRWVNANRCDFYAAKYLKGQFMGFLIAEEYMETGKDCYVSVDEAWDASGDLAMSLEVQVRDHIAAVTMTGDTTGFSGTLHFDLTKSAQLDQKPTEKNPVVLTKGLLKKAIKGSGKYTAFEVDKATYEGNKIVWQEAIEREEKRKKNAVATPMGDFVPGEFTAGSFSSEGVTNPFQIYLPENYDPAQSYPLMLFLHGNGSRGMDNRQIITGSEFVLCRKITKEYPNCIVIAPQTPVDWVFDPGDDQIMRTGMFCNYDYEDWRPSKYLQNVVRMLDAMKTHLPVDGSRVYVSGYSRGAMATWYLVATYPDTFAAAIMSCGVGAPDAAQTIARTPIYVYHGTVDDVVSYEDDKALAEAVAEAGGEVIFIPCENYYHSISAPMNMDKEVLPWLFSHSK